MSFYLYIPCRTLSDTSSVVFAARMIRTWTPMLALFLLVGAAATASAQDELACFWVRATFPRGVRRRGVFFVLGGKKMTTDAHTTLATKRVL